MEVTSTFHTYQISHQIFNDRKNGVEIDKIEKSKTEKVNLTIKFCTFKIVRKTNLAPNK